MNSLNVKSEAENSSWINIVARYNHPNPVKSWVQFTTNLLLYSFIWFLMYESLSISYWITLGLSIFASGMLVRLFIIYHDCGHGSFFKSRRLRDFMGLFIGVLTLTPYYSWSHSHQVHHNTSGNLDRRGTGDIWTMTVDEYRQSTLWRKIVYRFYRNPITMFGVGPLYVFLIGNRFTKKFMDRKGKMGVYVTNAALAVYITVMVLLIGLKAFLLIQFPITYLSGILGFWLFYVQHQFDPSYWARTDGWDYKRVALEGSSYYKLPRILQYFTGNIGFHHIHHLSPLIPNYNLSRCHSENPMFQDIKPLRFWASFRTMAFRLWNEKTHEMISFRKLKYN